MRTRNKLDKIIQKIKNLIPRILIEASLKFVTFWFIKYYSLKFNPLIIRKNTTDIKVFQDVFILRSFEIPIDIKPKLIIDAGAYTGYTSLFFSSKYPDAKIIAVEPEESNFRILEKNTKNIPNITRVKAGLWCKDGFLKIVDSDTGHWGFMVEEVTSSDNYDIKAVTINTLLKNTGFGEIDILKIDIEGSEKKLFSNNTYSWLNKVNIIMIELHDRIKDSCTKTFYSAVSKYKWKKFKKGEKIILFKNKLFSVYKEE